MAATSSFNTEQKIIDSFWKIIKIKKTGKITVQEIVEDCGINRKTFYYHFKDVYDLTDVAINRMYENLLRESEQAQSMEEAIKPLFKAMLETDSEIRSFLNREEPIITWRAIFGRLREYFYQLSEKRPITSGLSSEDIDGAVRFYSYAIAGIVLEANFQTEAEADRLVSRICTLIRFSEMNLCKNS